MLGGNTRSGTDKVVNAVVDRDEVDRLRKRFMKREQTLPAPYSMSDSRLDTHLTDKG